MEEKLIISDQNLAFRRASDPCPVPSTLKNKNPFIASKFHDTEFFWTYEWYLKNILVAYKKKDSPSLTWIRNKNSRSGKQLRPMALNHNTEFQE